MTKPPDEGDEVITPLGRKAVVVKVNKEGYVHLRYVGVDPTDVVTIHPRYLTLPKDWP